MPLSAYALGETIEQIVDDCERMSGGPKLNVDPATGLPPTSGNLKNAMAYRWMLDIIRALYLEYDWHFAIQARTLSTIQGDRCLCLPDDFWRVAYHNPLYGLIENQRFSIEHITRPQFFNTSSLDPTQKSRPAVFYIERPTALIYLNPAPDKAYIYELHYFKLISELTSRTQVPFFPYKDYLRAALLVRYYTDQDDSRVLAAEQMRQQIWHDIRGSNWDLREEPGQTPHSALDPQVFHTPYYEDDLDSWDYDFFRR